MIWIKTVRMLFGSITQELLGIPTFLHFDAIFEFLGQFTVKDAYIIFQNGVDNSKIEDTEHSNLGIGGAVPPLDKIKNILRGIFTPNQELLCYMRIMKQII